MKDKLTEDSQTYDGRIHFLQKSLRETVIDALNFIGVMPTSTSGKNTLTIQSEAFTILVTSIV